MRRKTRKSSESKTAETEKLPEKLKGKLLSDTFKKRSDLVAPWEPISTGFENLDGALNGGLIPELYVLGAESSAGKSTFMLNITEKIAAAKIHVMYFSLEMPSDYIARLLICHRLKELNGGLHKNLAMNNFTRKDGLERIEKEFGKGENPLFERAFEEYKKLGSYIRIIERDKENSFFNAKNIYNEVEKFKKQNKNQTPVVIVDYLQILDGKQKDSTADQRSVVDFNIGFLSQTANELKVPVIAISSLNRASYNGKPRDIALSSFKESGRIEYSADVVWALQSAGIYKEEFKKRAMRLTILKNRYGEKDVSVGLSFYPEFGLFEDTPADEILTETSEEKPKTIHEKTPKKTDTITEMTLDEEALSEIVPPEELQKAKENKKAQKDAPDTKCVYMLNSKISNFLRDNRNNSGVHKELRISRNNSKEKFHIAYYLRQKNKADGDTEPLTLWELAVLDAVCAITKKGEKKNFTIEKIYRFMCGKSVPTRISKANSSALKAALNKLNNSEMFIDITDELEMRTANNDLKDTYKVTPEELRTLPKDFPHLSEGELIKGTLLSFTKKDNQFQLADSGSILFDYTSTISGQYMKYDASLWGLKDNNGDNQVNFTHQKLIIRYYLIHEIKYSKTATKHIRLVSPSNGKEALLPLVVLSDSKKMKNLKAEGKGIENLRECKYFRRWLGSVREDTELILNDFVKHGLVSKFEWDKENQTFKVVLLRNSPKKDK